MTMHLISVTDVKPLLDSRAVHLLDVRLPEELEEAALAGALHVPLHELPGRHGELPRDKPIAVLCHHGVRSQTAARFLDQAGFVDAMSIEGGIDAWSLAIDPTLPRY